MARERTGREAGLMVFAAAVSALLGLPRGEAGAVEAGREWVNRVLVQIAPGPDALGGRIPGAWYGRDASRIAGREGKAPGRTARAALAEAERLYRAGRLPDAEKLAEAALGAGAALLK